jgi:hypothetical protein
MGGESFHGLEACNLVTATIMSREQRLPLTEMEQHYSITQSAP